MVPFFHLQSQQVSSNHITLPHLICLLFLLLRKLSTFKDNTGPTQTIQDNVPTSGSSQVIISAEFLLPGKVVYSVIRIRMWTSLGDHYYVYHVISLWWLSNWNICKQLERSLHKIIESRLRDLGLVDPGAQQCQRLRFPSSLRFLVHFILSHSSLLAGLLGAIQSTPFLAVLTARKGEQWLASKAPLLM